MKGGANASGAIGGADVDKPILKNLFIDCHKKLSEVEVENKFRSFVFAISDTTGFDVVGELHIYTI